MASRYHFGQSRPSLGETIGGALGTGLGQGLTALAETKLNSMLSRQRQAADKQKLVSLGIPDHEAEFLSNQDPETQWQAARAWLVAGGAPDNMLPRQLGEPFNITPEQEAAAAQQLGIQSPQQNAMAALEQLEAQGVKRQTAADLLTQEAPLSPHVKQALGQTKIERPGAIEALKQQVPQLPVALPQQAAPQQPAQAPVVSPRQEVARQQRPRNLGEAFKIAGEKPGLTAKESAREAAQLRKEAIAEQKEANKETKAYYDQTLKAKKGAHNNNLRLKRMEKLIKEGSLPFSALYSGFNDLAESNVGKDIPIIGGIANAVAKGIGYAGKTIQRNITSRDIDEYEKLTNDFLRDAKNIFGSRITDVDLQAFMRIIPTLAQTNYGKEHIIKNMKIFNDAAEAEAKAMEDIIKENGGQRPFDLQARVEERTRGKLDELADRFISGV